MNWDPDSSNQEYFTLDIPNFLLWIFPTLRYETLH